MTDSIYFNGQFKGAGTFNKDVTAVAIKNKRFAKFGTDDEILKLKAQNTKLIDLQKKIVIPGLNDSHIHLIRGGLNFVIEKVIPPQPGHELEDFTKWRKISRRHIAL